MAQNRTNNKDGSWNPTRTTFSREKAPHPVPRTAVATFHRRARVLPLDRVDVLLWLSHSALRVNVWESAEKRVITTFRFVLASCAIIPEAKGAPVKVTRIARTMRDGCGPQGVGCGACLLQSCSTKIFRKRYENVGRINRSSHSRRRTSVAHRC